MHVHVHHLAGTSSSVPTVGDRIILASDTLKAKGDASKVVGDGVNATLQAATETDVPVAHAAVPATANKCSDELLLNGSPSTTTSVFPLSYLWQAPTDIYFCTACYMHMHMCMHMCMHTYMYCDRAALGVAYTHKEVCTRTAGGRWCGRRGRNQ